MTVETTNRKQTFSGGQGSLTFSFRTLVSNPEYIKTLVKLVSTGAETELTYGVDYTVSVNSDGVGGTVTVLPTYSTSYNYVVYRETTATQGDDYDDFNQFPADTLENSLDRAIMIAQEQQEETERTLRYPISASGASTELPVPEANAFIQWNATADALINAVIPDPSTLIKATTAEAEAGVEDTHYMTPAKTADAIAAISALTKATQSVAEAASNDTDYMTPLQVKNEVQKAGAVSIPIDNIPYKDEDDMSSDSSSFVPTQQSTKAYVDGAITDYSGTSTIVGWSSFSVKKILYKRIGKTVFVDYYIDGTSNSTSVSFTLPFATLSGLDRHIVRGISYDNGSILTTPGRTYLPASSSTVTCYKDMASGAWTASNQKVIAGQFFYTV